jgi:hypothetical protein
MLEVLIDNLLCDIEEDGWTIVNQTKYFSFDTILDTLTDRLTNTNQPYRLKYQMIDIVVVELLD